MERRKFIRGGIVAAACATTLSAPSVARSARHLTMVTTWPKNLPGTDVSAREFARNVELMSGGEIRITVYSSGELVPPFESFDAVSSGTADLYHGAEYYWQGKSLAFNFFTTVPFGLTATEMNAWLLYDGGQELWDELSGRFNIKAFPAGNSGVQMGGWYNREINTVADFKGLKVRMAGLGGEVLRRVGAETVMLPASEILGALESGTIDAAEWIGPWNDLSFGFHKVAKYYYYPGFHEPGPTLSIGINKGVWDGFSDGHQAVIRAAALEQNSRVLAEFNARNAEAMLELRDGLGVQFRRFNDEVLNAIGQSAGRVVREVGESDELSRRIYDSFIKSRRKSMAWTRIAEHAFRSSRLLPFDY
ncbi:MAG: TRAP transporter substrate-binding protein [Rhodospirillales bacterium]